MHKKAFLAFLLTASALAACTPAPVPTPRPTIPVIGTIIPLSSPTNTPTLLPTPTSYNDAQMQIILTRMLNSHLYWDSIKGSAEITWFRKDGTFVETYLIDFYIEQPNKAYIDTRSKTGLGMPILSISDGVTRYGVVATQNWYFKRDLRDLSQEIDELPSRITDVEHTAFEALPGVAHPFSSYLLSPVQLYLYPQWVVYRNAEVQYVFLENSTLLGRSVWVFTYNFRNGRTRFTAWVDKETGIIVKYTSVNEHTTSMYINSLEINPPPLPIDLSILQDLEERDSTAAPYRCFLAPGCSW